LCYLLAIGAVADPLRLAAFFEEHLQVDVAAAKSTILAVFPAENVVRLLTRGGCSCELLELHVPAQRPASPDSIRLTLACRHALAIAAAQLGSVSIYVRSRKEWRPGRTPRLVMTIGELLQWGASVPVDLLVDVVAGIAPEHLH